MTRFKAHDSVRLSNNFICLRLDCKNLCHYRLLFIAQKVGLRDLRNCQYNILLAG